MVELEPVLNQLRLRLARLKELVETDAFSQNVSVENGESSIPAAMETTTSNTPLRSLQLERRLARVQEQWNAKPALHTSVSSVCQRLDGLVRKRRCSIPHADEVLPRDGRARDKIDPRDESPAEAWDSCLRVTRADVLRDVHVLRSMSASPRMSGLRAQWKLGMDNVRQLLSDEGLLREQLQPVLDLLKFHQTFQVEGGEVKSTDDVAHILRANVRKAEELEQRWHHLKDRHAKLVQWANQQLCRADLALMLQEQEDDEQ